MKRFRTMALSAVIVAALASQSLADILTPPADVENTQTSTARGGVDSDAILIGTLAFLLIWAAIQQAEGAK